MAKLNITLLFLCLISSVLAFGGTQEEGDDRREGFVGKLLTTGIRYRSEYGNEPGRENMRTRHQYPRQRRQDGYEGNVLGPVHTFVKTDEHAHFKWGVRHHAG